VPSLIRLVYASRSTFSPRANQQGLDPGVARILAQSRKNNARRRIVGGLLFGNGNFLQCLEGEADEVEALYKKIEADTRHRDVTMLARRTITERSFGAWSMKYAPGEQALTRLLHSWGLPAFDPYELTPQRVEAAVQYMLEGDDAAVDTQPGELDDAPADTTPGALAAPAFVMDQAPSSPTAGGSRSTAAPPAAVPAKRGNNIALWSVLALGVAVGLVVWWLRR
jgi:hypothetical protein